MSDIKKCFSIGDKIQIDYVDAVGSVRKYVSQVVNVLDDDFIDVLVPIHKKQNVYIRKGSILKLIASKGDAIYEIKTVLVDRIPEGIPLLRLKGISEIHKIQRRSFYRLKYFKEVNARLVLDMKKGEYGESFKCNIQDISLGGIMLSTAKHLNDKDIIEINLDLDEKIKVVHGVVVRRILKESNKNIYFYGVEYVGLTTADSNNINKFIFKEQRRLIKKGLI